MQLLIGAGLVAVGGFLVPPASGRAEEQVSATASLAALVICVAAAHWTWMTALPLAPVLVAVAAALMLAHSFYLTLAASSSPDHSP